MLLDEPTQGMGHEDVGRIVELIRKVSANRTVLMVEHNLSVVANLSDTITVMQRGSILAEGPTPRFRETPRCSRPTSGRPMSSGAEPAVSSVSAFTPRFEYLRVTDLHAFYGESHILHGIDFTVNRGELVTLLGRNGAGRTTTLKAILGLVRQAHRFDHGERDGRRSACPTHRIAHLGIGYCPEERGIYASLSLEENLLLPPVVSSGGMALEEIYGMFPQLARAEEHPGDAAVGRRAADAGDGPDPAHRGHLLLLDEITEGLAPVIVQTLGRVIREPEGERPHHRPGGTEFPLCRAAGGPPLRDRARADRRNGEEGGPCVRKR